VVQKTALLFLICRIARNMGKLKQNFDLAQRDKKYFFDQSAYGKRIHLKNTPDFRQERYQTAIIAQYLLCA